MDQGARAAEVLEARRHARKCEMETCPLELQADAFALLARKVGLGKLVQSKCAETIRPEAEGLQETPSLDAKWLKGISFEATGYNGMAAEVTVVEGILWRSPRTDYHTLLKSAAKGGWSWPCWLVGGPSGLCKLHICSLCHTCLVLALAVWREVHQKN